MRPLFFAVAICLFSCKQSHDADAEKTTDVPKKHRDIVPEPIKFTLPVNAPYTTQDVYIYYDTGVDKINDTVQVRTYVLDTVRVFISGYEGVFNDTLILSKNYGSVRGTRNYGNTITEFKGQKKLRFNGRDIVIKKYGVYGARTFANVYVNDSLGKILTSGLTHPVERRIDKFYNRHSYGELHNQILTDTVFSKIE